MSKLVMFCLLICAGCSSDSTGVDIVPAFLTKTNGETVVVEAPATAKAGESFSVVIHPNLTICGMYPVSPMTVEGSGLAVDLFPQVTSPRGAADCPYPDPDTDTAQLRFDQPGIAAVRIHGRDAKSNALDVVKYVTILPAS